MKVLDLGKLVASVLVCFLAAFIGSVATAPFIDTWYASLAKPFFTPPNWVFGPVWTTLYFLMGISLFLVWRQGLKTRHVKRGMLSFFVQLALNALWSFAFFGCQSLLMSVGIILLLWLAIVNTMHDFNKVSKKAVWLLAPYILWVTLATALNISIYLLNP